MTTEMCSHGCGREAPGIGGYCDRCNTDACLVPGPDGDGICGDAPRSLGFSLEQQAQAIAKLHDGLRACLEIWDVDEVFLDEELRIVEAEV